MRFACAQRCGKSVPQSGVGCSNRQRGPSRAAVSRREPRPRGVSEPRPPVKEANPSFYSIHSSITEVATRCGFNYGTAGFVIGAAMASSCPQHVEQFDAALGEEFDVIP